MIEVERKSPDGLYRAVWRFHASGSVTGTVVDLRLMQYMQQTRKSRRHGWNVIPGTDYQRTNRVGDVTNKDAVTFPEDVIAEAKSKVEIRVHTDL